MRKDLEMQVGEYRHLQKDGQVIDVDVWARRLPGMTGSSRLALLLDITQRKRADGVIQGLNRRYQELLAAASEVAIIATDRDGVITMFNRGAEKMLGYGAEELMIDRHTPARFHLAEEVVRRQAELSAELGHPVEGFAVFVAKAERTGSDQREWTYLRKDGQPITVSLAVTPVHSDGNIVSGYLGVAVDISERKAVEAEVARNLVETKVLGSILRLAIEDLPLDQILDAALRQLVSLPWLAPQGRGEIVLGPAEGGDGFGQYHLPIRGEAELLGTLKIDGGPGHRRDAQEAEFLGIVADTLGGIIKRKRVEEELRYSEDLAKTLMNASADAAMLMTEDGIVLAVNEAMALRFNAKPEGLVGRQQYDLIPAELAAARRAQHDEARRRDQPIFTQDERDGLVLDNRIYPVHDVNGKVTQLAIFSRDVTELHRSERKIRELLAFQRAILANTPIGIAVFSKDRRCIEANEAFARIYGTEVEQIVGQNAEILYADPEQYADIGRRAYPLVQSGGTFGDDIPMRRRDGTAIWARLGAHMVDNAMPDLGVIWTAEDISEHKTLEMTLKRTNAELEQFAYIASHDLRAPLRTVSSYLGLIAMELGDKLSEDMQTYIDFAVGGAKRMDRLILDLLEYSRAGRQSAPFQSVSLAELVAEALLNLEVAIQEAEAEIVVAKDLPTLQGDPTELTRLFQNLIGNAVKYHAPDRRPTVEIGWHATGHEVELWVRDNGIGISAKDFDRAFGIFQRLVAPSQYEGTGIGLAVCKKIVEHHGGRIWIESTEGQGSTFFIALPNAAAVNS
jgi:PAS domain S-box-containing protein